MKFQKKILIKKSLLAHYHTGVAQIQGFLWKRSFQNYEGNPENKENPQKAFLWRPSTYFHITETNYYLELKIPELEFICEVIQFQHNQSEEMKLNPEKKNSEEKIVSAENVRILKWKFRSQKKSKPPRL